MRLLTIGVVTAVVGFTACADEAPAPDPSAAEVERRDAGVPDAATETPAGTDAGETPPPPPPVPGLRAEYFDRYHDLVVERIEAAIDHDWKDESPATGVGKDRFSVRWTGTLTPTVTGETTLAVDADDGVRLWVGDKLVINDWRAHFVERHTAKVALEAGEPVQVRLDYFEADLAASVRLSWSAPGLDEQVIGTEQWTTRNEPTKLVGPKPPFRNPVISFDCPDPGVVGVPGDGDAEATFYAVCTGGPFPIRKSRDLVTWEDTGKSILPAGKPAWAANGNRNWAPEIHRAGADYLAYYTTVNAANVLSIGVAKAPSPEGPWTDRGSPLVEDPRGVIDATFFEDEDGSRWLVYKIDANAQNNPTPMLVRQLASDGMSFAPGSTAKQILVNDPGTWEGGVVEAPWIVKRNGTYFMFYSGNVYDHRYRTGVARAKSLTGPWEKKGAPVLTNNAAWVGPGHGSVVPAGGRDYFVYHAWQNAGNGTHVAAGGRKVLVDPITYENGWPKIGNGSPSNAAQLSPVEPR